MDYSKFSDSALEELSKGKNVDYSKFTDDELEILSTTKPAAAAEPKRRPAFAAVNDTLAGILESAKGVGQWGAETVEGVARGSAQGLTGGHTDELVGSLLGSAEGGAQAAGNLIGGDYQSEELAAYEKERDESRAAFAASEENSPYANMVGNLIGSVAPALLTGGSTFAGLQAAKAAPTLGKALLSGGSVAAKGMAVGAGSGAFSALGESEGSGQDLLDDVKAGALVGGGMGGALGGASVGLSKVAKKGKEFLSKVAEKSAKESETAEHLVKGAKTGWDKEAIMGRTTQAKDTGGFNKEVDEIVGSLNTRMDELAAEQEAILTGSTATIDLGSIGTKMKILAQKMRKEGQVGAQVDLEKFNKHIDDMTLNSTDGSGLFETPLQAHTTRKNMYNDLYRGKSDSPDSGLYKTFAKLLSDELKAKVPELVPLDKQIGSLADALKPLGRPKLFRSLKPEERGNWTTQASSMVRGMSNVGDEKARQGADDFFKKLNNHDPSLGKTTRERMEAASRSRSFTKDLATDSTLSSKMTTMIAGGVKNLGIYTAHAGGRLAKGTMEAAKAANPARVISKTAGALYDWPVDRLTKVANKLTSGSAGSSDTNGKLGRLLTEAASREGVNRTALLYAIEQNPMYREALNLTDEEEDVEVPEVE